MNLFKSENRAAKAIQVEHVEIERLRDLYREEINCQIVHDSVHRRPGWTIEYLLNAGGAAAGTVPLPSVDHILNGRLETNRSSHQ